MPCGKIIHSSAHAAQRALAAVKRRSRRAKEGVMGAYFCESCQGWHWGHATARMDHISRRKPLEAIVSETGAAFPRDPALPASSVVRADSAKQAAAFPRETNLPSPLSEVQSDGIR